MKDTDTERIMAYADGELPDEARAAVEALLASDPQAREMLARFRQTGALLDPVARALLSEPVPQRLIDTVRQHPMASEKSPVARMPEPSPGPIAVRVTTAVGRVPANDSRFWPRWGAAAGIALAVGLVTGHWWGSQGPGSGPDLAQVLQNEPSGAPVALAEGHVMPLASFQRAGGQACREFEQSREGRLSHGIACHAGGVWVTQILIDRGPDEGQIGQPPAFLPASGQADALAAMAETLGLGETLAPDQEEALIRNGWAARP